MMLRLPIRRRSLGSGGVAETRSRRVAEIVGLRVESRSSSTDLASSRHSGSPPGAGADPRLRVAAAEDSQTRRGSQVCVCVWATGHVAWLVASRGPSTFSLLIRSSFSRKPSRPENSDFTSSMLVTGPKCQILIPVPVLLGGGPAKLEARGGRPACPRPGPALPATAASCLLRLSRRRLPGTSPLLSPLRAAVFRCYGGSSVACSCSPGPPPAVPAEQRGCGAGQATFPEATVRIVAVVGEGTISPIKDTPWEDVMRHTADRLKWVDEGFEMIVFTDNLIEHDNLRKELSRCDMLVNVAITNQDAVQWLINNSKDISNVICFQSSPSLLNKLGGTYVQYTGEQDMFGKLASIGKPSGKESAEILKTISNAWERHNSEDIRFCLLVVVNAYIRPVAMLKNLRAKGLSTLSCMIKNCGPQILNCLFDPNCRKALQCLNSCSPTDQVCNYRCIASYESPYLEAFSLCVLQKNNCLDLNAEIPSKPNVIPLTMFRGQKLSHEIAEDLFVGWLDSMEWSWRVAAGQNPAYDQFPCQYQLFYRGKAKGSFWYEPVFQVKTLEGKLIWRRRRYRVRRASTPGTFYFSVLDNGVVSKEFWTIVDVAEDFSWGLFHYHGAAQAAGLSYTGAVLVTPDGSYPDVEDPTLASALEKCDIKKWELYTVDNSCCMGAPLGTPEGSKLHQQISPGKETGIMQRR